MLARISGSFFVVTRALVRSSIMEDNMIIDGDDDDEEEEHGGRNGRHSSDVIETNNVFAFK